MSNRGIGSAKNVVRQREPWRMVKEWQDLKADVRKIKDGSEGKDRQQDTEEGGLLTWFEQAQIEEKCNEKVWVLERKN